MRTKFFLFFALISAGAFAQSNTDQHTLTITVPSVALLDLEPSSGKNLSVSFNAPTDPGLALVLDPAAVLNSVYLNYTSVLSSATKRNITVSMTGSLTGVQIKVTAGAATATGAGEKGTPTSEVTLSGTEQTIIQDVGSAYTGTGSGNGHQLTYVVDLPSSTFGSLVSGNKVATIKYTLSGD
jgi:hypothetical protein